VAYPVFTRLKPQLNLSLCLLIFILCVLNPAKGQKPNDAASAHFRQGRALYGKGDLNRAIASYDEAIKLKPTWAEAYLQRGYAQRMNGKLDEAIDDFERATLLDPRTTRNNLSVAQAYGNRGQICRNRLEVEGAISDFDKAISLYVEEAQPYLDRGQARLLLEDFAGAVTDFDSCLKKMRDPFGRALAYADRSLANRLLGRDEEAKKDMDEMLKLVKGDKPEVMRHLHELELQLIMLRHLRAKEKKVVA